MSHSAVKHGMYFKSNLKLAKEIFPWISVAAHYKDLQTFHLKLNIMAEPVDIWKINTISKEWLKSTPDSLYLKVTFQSQIFFFIEERSFEKR